MNSNLFIAIITVTFTTVFSGLVFLVVKKSFSKDVTSQIDLIKKDVQNVDTDMKEMKIDMKEISKSISSVVTSILELRNNFLKDDIVPLTLSIGKNESDLKEIKKDVDNLARMIRKN